MAKRGWSLTDAQLERRRQNPAARRSTRPDAATTRAKVTARKQATSRPSDYQQRRASRQKRESWRPESPMEEATSARATYSYPDAASISSRPSNGAATTAPVHDPYSRAPGLMSNTGMRAKTRTPAPVNQFSSNDLQLQRKTNYSSMSPYRAADASMFNSNVTPKAKRVEGKKPRSRMSPDQNVFW